MNDVEDRLNNAKSWMDAYNLAKELERNGDPEDRSTVLRCYEEAFALGLNVFSNKNAYMDAVKSSEKLYLFFGRYSEVCNKFIQMEDNGLVIPDWLHLDYASAMIHRKTTFMRDAVEPEYLLERLQKASGTQENKERSQAIFSEFISLCEAEALENESFRWEKEKVYECAAKLDTQEEKLENTEDIRKKAEVENGEDNLYERFDEDAGSDELSEKEKRISDLMEELQSYKEKYLSMENERVIMSQKIQDQEKTIGSLKGIDEQSKRILNDFERMKNDILEKDGLIEKYKKEAESTRQQLIEITKLPEIEVPKKERILLIVGGTETSEKVIKGMLPLYGFSKKHSEIYVDYDKIKKILGSLQPGFCKYDGIIIGPIPHKVENLGDNSSFIEKLKNEEGYPHVEVCRSLSDELKISKESIRNALSNMKNHLDAIGLSE